MCAVVPHAGWRFDRGMIRWARPHDVPVLERFIRELAEYERLAHQCRADRARLAEHLFGPRPACEALVAEAQDGTAVGFALFFTAYSTFECAPFVWLEDLYVTPSARGQGHGKALLQVLAAIACARGQPRLQWQVLEWNAPAIDFYAALGAPPMRDWQTCRLAGDALAAFAAGTRVPPLAAG